MKEDVSKRQKEIQKPLFTGDYRRDPAVSEIEKAAEASNFLFDAIMQTLKKALTKFQFIE